MHQASHADAARRGLKKRVVTGHGGEAEVGEDGRVEGLGEVGEVGGGAALSDVAQQKIDIVL